MSKILPTNILQAFLQTENKVLPTKFLSLVFVSLFFLPAQSWAQGETCATAASVTTGTHTANGPSSGGGANNTFDGTNADWYSFTTPATNGLLTVSACADPGDTDTRLFIYDGSCGSLNEVGNNDDACNTSGYSSRIQNLSVAGNTTYYIEWDDRWSTSGFDWELSYTPCTISASISSQTNLACNGGSSGTVTVTTTGGATNYNYAWSNGSTTNNSPSTTDVIGGLAAGTYTVTVTDANGCTATASATLTEPASAVSANAVASGSDINLTASGGTPSYTYAWSTGATTEDISGLSVGTYTVTVTDANSCTTTASATISLPSETICYNSLPDTLESNTIPSGGSGNYVYEWQISADGLTGWTAAPGKNDSIAYIPTVPLTDTTYFRREVTDTSCSDVGYSNIKGIYVLDSLSISASVSNAICGAANGSIDLTVSGGQSPYTYLWSNAATTEDLSSVSAGNYTVTVTDNIGCTTSKSIEIVASSTLIASAATDSNASCNGDSNGGATASATGGTAAYTYSWSNGATTASISGVMAGTYSVTVTDQNGCTDSASVTVTEPALLVAAGVVDSNISCNGGSDGGATASATGGTAAYTYSWSNGATTASISGVMAGTYSVTITDQNGCTDSASVTVTEPALLVAAGVVDNNISCNGGSDGGATASATGGTAAYTYSWSNGATTASISSVSAGTYSVTITDQNGCTDSASVTVTEPATLVAAGVVDSNISCNGGSDGGATASATGGTAAYTYSWSNGATTASISGVMAGTYSVTITDQNGCTDSASVTVTEPAILFVSNTPTDASCPGGDDGFITTSVTGGTAAYTYSWSNSATSQDIIGLAAGTYTVTVTDANGCTATASSTIAQPSALEGGDVGH